MKRLEKLRKFLKNPGVWLFAFYAALAAFAAADICVAVLWNGKNAAAYALYAATAVLLLYCIYATAAPLKSFFKKVLASNRIATHMCEDYGYRTFMFSALSFFINVAYALLQGVLAIVYFSAWYGVFAAYYLVLSLLRGGVILAEVKSDRRSMVGERKERFKVKIFLGGGVMIIALSMALACAVSFMILTDTSFRYAGNTIYIMAVYAFYKIILSAINIVKAKKYMDFGVQTFRNINFIDALVSVFALQTAMIAAFGEEGQSSMRMVNIVTGAVVFFLALGTGVYMIIRAAAILKKNHTRICGEKAPQSEKTEISGSGGEQ